MGWLWLVGSIKVQVSFATKLYKRDYILQKRHVILSILRTIATPYYLNVCLNIHTCMSHGKDLLRILITNCCPVYCISLKYVYIYSYIYMCMSNGKDLQRIPSRTCRPAHFISFKYTYIYIYIYTYTCVC